MARRTSIEAYEQIAASGLLSHRRFEVYAWLFQHGPATAGRVARGIHGNRNNTATRLSELRDRGVVEEIGVGPELTDMEVIVWDVTDLLPVEPAKAKCKTYKELVAENKRLLAENERLKRALGKRRNWKPLPSQLSFLGDGDADLL